MLSERRKRVKQSLKGLKVKTPCEAYTVFKIESIDFEKQRAWCLCINEDNKYIKRWVKFEIRNSG